MALNFPNSPSDGDTYEDFYWDATAGIWRRQLSVTNIDDLQDVSATSPTDNDLLVYDSATSSWISESLETGFTVVTSTTRPSSPFTGQAIYESDTELSFVWDGTAWQGVGGAGAAGGAITLNTNEITDDYTFETGYNGVSAGPITIASGVTVTVPTDSAWSIV